MDESERLRVQREAREVVAPSVHRVAEDRMSGLGEMHPDLIAPAGLQRQFEDRIPFSLRGRPVMRDRFLPLGRTLHAQLAIFGEKRSERAGWWFQSAMHDRDVDPLDVVHGEELLQLVADERVLREDEHARGVAIESMN